MNRACSLCLFASVLGASSIYGCASPVEDDAGPDAQLADLDRAPDAGASTDAMAGDGPILDAGPDDAATVDVGPADGGVADDASAVTVCDLPTQLDSASMSVIAAQIRSNGRGSMLVGWLEVIDVANHAQYVARVYQAGAFRPEHRFLPASSVPPIQDLDGNGNAVAFFFDELQDFDAYRSAYDATTMTWSTPESWLPMHHSSDSNGYLRIDANASGGAIYVTDQHLPSRRGVYATHSDPSTGVWSALEPLEMGIAASPTVGINDAGQAVAVWLQTDVAPPALHARGLQGGVWSPVASVGQGARGGASSIHVLPNGDALVGTSSVGGLAVRRFSPSAPAGTEWSALELLPGPANGPPKVLVDADGIVTIAWESGSGAAARLLLARDLGAGFGTPVDLGPAYVIPTIALDSVGAVSALVKIGNARIGLTRISQRGTVWSAPFEVAPTAMGPGINQSIDVMHDEQDRPIVVFDAIANGTRHLFAAVCH